MSGISDEIRVTHGSDASPLSSVSGSRYDFTGISVRAHVLRKTSHMPKVPRQFLKEVSIPSAAADHWLDLETSHIERRCPARTTATL